jgi:hypothetical protein
MFAQVINTFKQLNKLNNGDLAFKYRKEKKKNINITNLNIFGFYSLFGLVTIGLVYF